MKTERFLLPLLLVLHLGLARAAPPEPASPRSTEISARDSLLQRLTSWSDSRLAWLLPDFEGPDRVVRESDLPGALGELLLEPAGRAHPEASWLEPRREPVRSESQAEDLTRLQLAAALGRLLLAWEDQPEVSQVAPDPLGVTDVEGNHPDRRAVELAVAFHLVPDHRDRLYPGRQVGQEGVEAVLANLEERAGAIWDETSRSARWISTRERRGRLLQDLRGRPCPPHLVRALDPRTGSPGKISPR